MDSQLHRAVTRKMREMSREHQEELERREEDLMSPTIVVLFVAHVHLAERNIHIYIYYIYCTLKKHMLLLTYIVAICCNTPTCVIEMVKSGDHDS